MLGQVSQAINNPLPPLVIEPKKSKKKKGQSGAAYSSNIVQAREARMAKVRTEYRAALFDQNLKTQKWYTSAKIEARAGKARAGSYDVLQRMVAEGLLQRRPAGGMEFNRRWGWEYRWVGG